MILAFCPTFLWPPVTYSLASGEARLLVCFSMKRSLGRYYVRYIKQPYGRAGTLWEGRCIEFKHQLL